MLRHLTKEMTSFELLLMGECEINCIPSYIFMNLTFKLLIVGSPLVMTSSGVLSLVVY